LQAFKQILEGTFACLPECDPYLPLEINPIPHETSKYTRGDYVNLLGIQNQLGKAQETTASLLWTIHFGHYIAEVANSMVGKLNAILANMRLVSTMAPER